MKNLIKVLLIFLISYNNTFLATQYNNTQKETNITVHLITRLEITQIEYKFITSFFNITHHYESNLSLLFRHLVIRNCKGKIKWEKLNLTRIGDILPVNSYMKLLGLISDHLPLIKNIEVQKELLTQSGLISDYYSRKFIGLKSNHSDYNHIGKLCETWLWITDNLNEILRNELYDRFSNEPNAIFDSKFRMFTPKCFPLNSMVSSYKKNFKEYEISDPYACYSIIMETVSPVLQRLSLGLENSPSNNSEILNYLTNGSEVFKILVYKFDWSVFNFKQSWFFIKSEYNHDHNVTQYKIKNCYSGIFLYAAKILDDKGIFKFDIFGSKNEVQVNKNNVMALSNLWTFIPLNNGENYAIVNLAISHRGFIPIISNEISSKLKVIHHYINIERYISMSSVLKLEKYKDNFPNLNICYELNWLGKLRRIGESLLKITKIKIETDNEKQKFIVNSTTSRSSTWRLIQIGFNDYIKGVTFRIRNCESHEYLVWSPTKRYGENRFYVFTVSEEELRNDDDNKKELKSLWAITLQGIHIIDAYNASYYLYIQDNRTDHKNETSRLLLFVDNMKMISLTPKIEFNQWEFETVCS